MTMFDFLKRNKTKKKTAEPGMIKTTATSFEPNRVETSGAVIGNPQEEELAKPPTTQETEDGEVVVELGQFENDRRVAESEEKPETFDISPDSARKSALFTEEECAKIEEQYKKHERFSEEELASKRRVEEALNDPDIPASDRDSLWVHLCRVEGKLGMDEIEEYSSKEEAIQSELGDRDWVEPETPEHKKIEDLTGSDFKQLIQQAQNPQNEELEQSPVEFEGVTEREDETVESVDEELAEPASDAFRERAQKAGKDYWNDLAEEIEMEKRAPDNTEVMSVNPGVVFRTENQSMREELQYEATCGENVEILSDSQGVLEAHVIDPSKYR